MKTFIFSVSFSCLALFLSACGGPSKAELRAELQGIESEMMQLEMAANNFRSQMTQAEWQSILGGFAFGYGLVGGDSQLAMDGGGAWAGAAGNLDRAHFSLQQVQNRYNQLAQRRAEIMGQL